jgi:hypothetical protein
MRAHGHRLGSQKNLSREKPTAEGVGFVNNPVYNLLIKKLLPFCCQNY